MTATTKRIATESIGSDGRQFWIFEYDLTKPHMPEAVDFRAHYAVKRLVGVTHDPKEAERLLGGS